MWIASKPYFTTIAINISVQRHLYHCVSTDPIPAVAASLWDTVPAVYYAHLASKRAEAHIDMNATQRLALQEERRKHPGIEAKSHSEETKSWSEWPKLMPFVKTTNIHLGMWYI